MSFLAPLFLLGALAVALPVMLHLSRRSTRQRTLFSSLMFLRATPPRLTRRNRLEHLLLLLLRCAVVVLLAGAFARPFLRRDLPEVPARGMPRRVSVLLDTSASMRRGSLWREACQKAEALAQAAAAQDHFGWQTFDRESRPLLTFEDWEATPVGERVALVRSRLAACTPGWLGTHLDEALLGAAEALAGGAADPTPARRQVVLISDLQAGSRTAGLAAREWPRGVELVIERLAPRTSSNAGLQVLAESALTERLGDLAVRVRVGNEPDSRREQFRLAWSGASGASASAPLDIYVPPGQSRVAVLSLPPGATDLDRIVLTGDEEAFDNTVFVVPPETAHATVLYLGPEPETDTREPLFFLRRAFQETRRQAVHVLARPPTVALREDELAAASLVVVTAPVSEPVAAALREGVGQGKVLLCAPTSVAAATSLGPILGGGTLAVEEGTFSNYGMLGEISFSHPLFAPFADARYSDFTKVRFWKHRRFAANAVPGASVLARFDNGAPAIFETALGRGRVIVWTAGWQPADSQLALSSKFVPLLYSLLELAGARLATAPGCTVGDTLPGPPDLAPGATRATITRPDGTRLEWRASESATDAATMPGVYTVTAGATGASQRVAVNLEPSESHTAPLAPEDLERFGARVAPPPSVAPVARPVAHLVAARNVELENRQKLWRWVIVSALVALGAETWLAGRTARQVQVQVQVPAPVRAPEGAST
jgi:hypothetical protein